MFHQLFSRIMGNFSDRPDLVAVLMEVDALLTDAGVLGSDYVWGVWRRRDSTCPRRPGAGRGVRSTDDGVSELV